MQLSAPNPRQYKVLMSFVENSNCWVVVFWNKDRMRTPLPRRARFTTDESLIEFARRAGGCRTLEDRNILDMIIQRKSGGSPSNSPTSSMTHLGEHDAKKSLLCNSFLLFYLRLHDLAIWLEDEHLIAFDAYLNRITDRKDA
jgi:hypothetical protein